MNKKINIKIHNFFEFRRKSAKTGEIISIHKAENIILDNFWGEYFSYFGRYCLDYIHFGSGTTEPQATDVKLTSWLGCKQAPGWDELGTEYDFSRLNVDGVMSVKKTIQLGASEYINESVSEIGFSRLSNASSGLLTKAIIKDENGDPAPFIKGDGEVVDIVGTFYVILNYGDYIYPITKDIGGTGYTILDWLIFRQGSINGGYPAVIYSRERIWPFYNENYNPSTAHWPSIARTIDVENREVEYALSNTTASQGNNGYGFRGLSISGFSIHLPCEGFTQPVITKEVIGTGDGSTADFQTKFGFIKNNGTAKVYVNDVEVAATVDYDQMPPVSEISWCLNVLGYEEDEQAGTRAVILENPAHQKAGINSFRCNNYGTTYMSQDLENWIETTPESSSLKNVDPLYQNYRYIKVVRSASPTTNYLRQANSTAAAALTNIHLSTAPAEGDVVAVTYQPDCIAKDDQHTLNNVKLTLSFSEEGI